MVEKRVACDVAGLPKLYFKERMKISRYAHSHALCAGQSSGHPHEIKHLTSSLQDLLQSGRSKYAADFPSADNPKACVEHRADRPVTSLGLNAAIQDVPEVHVF